MNGTLFWLLCAGRVGSCLGTMAFAAALPVVRVQWQMDATTAGMLQMLYSVANAVALFAASLLCDALGPRRVYLLFSWLGVVALVLFSLLAHSVTSAAVLIVLVGLTQGGAYTPALMLAMQMYPASRRGFSAGAMLSAGSLGYLLSVFIASSSSQLLGVNPAFGFCAAGAFAGALLGQYALARWPDRAPAVAVSASPAAAPSVRTGLSLTALLLLVAYSAHCWELLASWAWSPTLLLETLRGSGTGVFSGGLLVAVAIHGSGMLATLTVGMMSDRVNRYGLLTVIAAAGALCSLLTGLAPQAGAGATLLMVAVASFFILGDSGVLSAAIADAVAPHRLGRVMGIRSLCGFGAGALAPVAVGTVLDASQSWALAWCVPAGGGLLACLSVIALRRAENASRNK